jgi:hypothetical protein
MRYCWFVFEMRLRRKTGAWKSKADRRGGFILSVLREPEMRTLLDDSVMKEDGL